MQNQTLKATTSLATWIHRWAQCPDLGPAYNGRGLQLLSEGKMPEWALPLADYHLSNFFIKMKEKHDIVVQTGSYIFDPVIFAKEPVVVRNEQFLTEHRNTKGNNVT